VFLDSTNAIADKLEKYWYFFVGPPAIALLACLWSPTLVKVFGLITLVLGHIVLGLKVRKHKNAGNRKGLLNVLFWEIALLLLVLGTVLIFGLKDTTPGIVVTAVGAVGLVAALATMAG
jgi:hypothetical protein